MPRSLNKFMIAIASMAFLCNLRCSEMQASETKTPTDVYRQARALKKRIAFFRKQKGMTNWPIIAKQTHKYPRHVLQKSLEILQKISRLRELNHLGSITIPAFPSRLITPNEVYDSVDRLVAEIEIVIDLTAGSKSKTKEDLIHGRKTPSDVYRLLWEISDALDPVLGIRGLNPNDVYQQSLHIVDVARFLRRSQNLPTIVKPRQLKNEKNPYHALLAANTLLKKIARTQKNLAIEEVEVKPVPRKVAKPRDVHNALGIISAELQRIKFQLGLASRPFKHPRVKGKTPNDVIVELQWATALLPSFSETTVQFDKRSLIKTPRHVFHVSESIWRELSEFVYEKGIRQSISATSLVRGLKPLHVYTKTLECLDKINRLRRQSNMGPMAVPRSPSRTITPTEVYDLTQRLKMELRLIFARTGIDIGEQSEHRTTVKKRTPSEVFLNMTKISKKIDLLLGKSTL